MPRRNRNGNRRRMGRNGRNVIGGMYRITGPSTVTSVVKTFPERMRVSLGYTTSGTFTGAVAADQVWNPNGAFDPDQTGAGHQPLGYDQYTAMYNRYLVHNAHWKCTFVHTGGTTACCIVGITAINGINTALNATQMTQALEGMRCKWTMSGPASTSANPFVLKGKVPLAKLVGATRERYLSDDRYQALISANPSELVGLHLFAYDSTFATNVAIAWNMEITYEMEFFDRVFPGQSLDRRKLLEDAHPPQFYRVLGTDFKMERKQPLEQVTWKEHFDNITSDHLLERELADDDDDDDDDMLSMIEAYKTKIKAKKKSVPISSSSSSSSSAVSK